MNDCSAIPVDFRKLQQLFPFFVSYCTGPLSQDGKTDVKSEKDDDDDALESVLIVRAGAVSLSKL